MTIPDSRVMLNDILITSLTSKKFDFRSSCRCKTADNSEGRIYRWIRPAGAARRPVAVAAAATACGVKNTCAAKHAAILRSVGRPKEASISPLIDRSAGASDKILSSFWSCPTHRRPSDGPHASCRLSSLPFAINPPGSIAARGPPTSWAQRRYLAEGKSLLDHPHRLLDAGAWATLFQGAHRVVRRIPPSRIHQADRGVGPTWVVLVLRKQSTALSGGRVNAGVRRWTFTQEHAPPGRPRGPRRGPVAACERDNDGGDDDADADDDRRIGARW
ncbi:Uncharacterized protein DBV15_04644 [Temnothorax longispinosus]|uniref:Uncharacterized protein n=1 Tax=Temnothorax longispinosus TaxID=300112 RepID=A0A4S2JRR1_9HYME|nr:Uncharacterized protein DBV15_04644 [Temnothorax longispinosus]